MIEAQLQTDKKRQSHRLGIITYHRQWYYSVKTFLEEVLTHLITLEKSRVKPGTVKTMPTKLIAKIVGTDLTVPAKRPLK